MNQIAHTYLVRAALQYPAAFAVLAAALVSLGVAGFLVDRVLTVAEHESAHGLSRQDMAAITKQALKDVLAEAGMSATQLVSRRRNRQLATKDQHTDWGDAPAVQHFLGRQEEVALLRRWLLKDRCNVVAILGIGGVGKTSLCSGVVHKVEQSFDRVFWRSLRNSLAPEVFLADLIAFLSPGETSELLGSLDEQLTRLMALVKDISCLIVLDNFETVLRADGQGGGYVEGYETYGRLVQMMGESKIRSCLFITSREKPREVAYREGAHSDVRSLVVHGLAVSEARLLLVDRGLVGSAVDWSTLVDQYSGNPLALKIISSLIATLFGGNITRFLATNTTVVGGIRDLLEQQFSPLVPPAQMVMYWLAVERVPTSFDRLQAEMLHDPSAGQLVEVLDMLHRRELIEQDVAGLFTLQPVVMEYVATRLVARICDEVLQGEFQLFNSLCLMKADVPDFVRLSQVQSIVLPVLEGLIARGSRESAERAIKNLVSKLRTELGRLPGYAGGNALNLLVRLGADVQDTDFSGLNIRHAYLNGAVLHEVDMSRCAFEECAFTEAFGAILSVGLSSDGEILAAASANDVGLWRATEGIPMHMLSGHTDWVRSISFSPDNELLASGSSDGTVRLWDIGRGECLRVLQSDAGRVWSVAFDPGGINLAAGCSDNNVQLWDAASGKLKRAFSGHTDWVRCVAFSSDGTLIASGSADHTARIWDKRTGACLATLSEHTAPVRAVAFHPSDSVLATGSEDGTVRLWDIHTSHCLRVLSGHAGTVYSVAFNADGERVASAGEDHSVRLWNTHNGEMASVLRGHTSRVFSLCSVGTMLASGSDDRTIRIWDFQSGQGIRTTEGYSNPVWAVAFSTGGDAVATGTENKILNIWRTESSEPLASLYGHDSWIRAVAFSPDGATMASGGGGDCTIRLWNLSTYEHTEMLHGHTNAVMSLAYDPDGARLVSGSEDGTVGLWDIRSRHCVGLLKADGAPVWAVAFSPVAPLVVSGAENRRVTVWDIDAMECRGVFSGHEGPVWAVAFSSDGAIVCSAGDDHALRFWSTESGECLDVWHGHTDMIRSVAFAPNGQQVASGGTDGTVRLWSYPTGELVNLFQGHDHSITSLAFHPNGGILASASADGTVRLWQLPTGTCLRVLRADRPYERMNIYQASGLSAAQLTTLTTLGAIAVAPTTS